jgi:type IV secretory pathway component VirB8
MTEPHDTKLTNSALLLQIAGRLSVIESKLDVLTDHEDRIRELEKARYKSAWITSVLSSALSAAIVFAIIKGLGG